MASAAHHCGVTRSLFRLVVMTRSSRRSTGRVRRHGWKTARRPAHRPDRRASPGIWAVRAPAAAVARCWF